jgi:hypothetical protein
VNEHLLVGGFPEALPAVTDGAPRTTAISMLAAIELRRNTAGLSCDQLARQLGRRRADVLHVLEDEPRRFTRRGQGRWTRWTLARGHGTDRTALPGGDATDGPPEPTRARRAA